MRRLNFVTPGAALRLSRDGVWKDETAWAYLGAEPFDGPGIPAAGRRSIGAALSEIARELRRPFIEWAAEAVEAEKDEVRRWALPFASRSPLQTDFFRLLCAAELAADWVESKRPAPDAVVVGDPWLYRMLRERWLSAPGVAFIGSWRADLWKRSAVSILRRPLAAAVSAWRLLRERSAGAALNRGGESSGDVGVVTWLEKRSFLPDGAFVDVDTGRLAEELAKQGREIVHVISAGVHPSFVRKLRGCRGRFVACAGFLSFRDVLDAALSLPRLPCSGGLSWRRWKISILLERELRIEAGHTRHAVHLAQYASFKKTAQRRGSGLKAVIYPFENQPWEKLMCAAIRAEAPHVRFVGYQSGFLPPLLLAYFPAKREMGSRILPDRVLSNGPANIRLFRREGFPEGMIGNGGILRFEYLFGLDRKKRKPVVGRPAVVLAACPISPRDTLEFVSALCDGFKDCGVRVRLKCHPHLPAEWVLRKLGRNFPPHVSVIEEPLSSALETSDVFVYTPPTGSWLEACWSGVPVLKFLHDGLDVDQDAELGVRIPACGPRDMAAAVTAAAAGAAPPVELPRLEDVFSAVRMEDWMNAIGRTT